MPYKFNPFTGKLDFYSAGGGGGSDSLLRGKYVWSTRFAIIGSGTSGTITKPSGSTIILDDFGGTTDAVVTTVASSKPLIQHAKDAAGTVLATSFNTSGDWTLTGTPSAYPIAIVYRVKQFWEDFDDTASDLTGLAVIDDDAVNNVLTGLSTASAVDITSADTILSALGKLQKQITEKPGLHPSLGIELLDHFISGGGGVNAGNTGWLFSAGSGQASASATGPNGTHIGVLAISTLTSATATPTLYHGNGSGIAVGLGTTLTYEFLLQVPVLSTNVQEYVLRQGLHTSLNATDPQNGIYFKYDRATTGDFWVITTRQTSTSTDTTTAIPVVAGQWYHFKIVANAAGTSVSFYIDGALVGGGPHTTNIPTGTGKLINPAHQMYKTVGTTARVMYLDWVYCKYIYGV